MSILWWVVAIVAGGAVVLMGLGRIVERRIAKQAVEAHLNPLGITDLDRPLPSRLAALKVEAEAEGFAPGAEYVTHVEGYDVTVASISYVSADLRSQLTGVVGFEDKEPDPLYSLISTLDGGQAALTTSRRRMHPAPPNEFVQTMEDGSLAELVEAHHHALDHLAGMDILPDRLDPEGAIELVQWEHELGARLFRDDLEATLTQLRENVRWDRHEGLGLLARQDDAEERIVTYLAGRSGPDGPEAP